MAAGSQTELIDEHVSANQCKLAVEALLTHEVKRQAEQQESQLLPGKEQTIWLGVTLKQMHAEKKLKPHRIPVAFPIVDPRSSSVCLITKDPQREYKDLLEEKKIRFISRVVGVEKLKGKFKGFEERRMLLKENDLFLADERVIPLLPKLLGNKFFVAKKQPIPVCLTRKDLKGELERAISSTYYHQNQGTSASIKIGTLSQPAGHILDNLKTALPALAKVINGGWDNIQSLGIKTGTSANLPIWTCELGSAEGGRWDGMVDVEMAEDDVAEDDDAPEIVEDAKSMRETRSKGKKRAAEEDEEKEKPKKKAKSSAEDSIPTKKAKDAPAPKVDASAAPEIPISAPKAKKCKEKRSAAEVPSEATPSAQAPTPAASSSATAEVSTPSAATGDKKERRKKRKNAAADNEAPSSAAPTSETPTVTTITIAAASHVEEASSEPQAEQRKKRKPRASAKKAAAEAASAPNASAPSAADPAPSVSVAAPAPVTPRTKKPRASAADFFEKDDADSHAAAAQTTPAPVAPPPNTPARRKRTKRVEETPVSKAIDKLVEGAKGEDAAAEAQAQQPEAENAKPKKERKKTRNSAAAAELKATAPADEPKATPTESAPSVTAQEVKAKRSSSGAEKKKDKALKAKRSATKDALLVKKKGL